MKTVFITAYRAAGPGAWPGRRNAEVRPDRYRARTASRWPTFGAVERPDAGPEPETPIRNASTALAVRESERYPALCREQCSRHRGGPDVSQPQPESGCPVRHADDARRADQRPGLQL